MGIGVSPGCWRLGFLGAQPLQPMTDPWDDLDLYLHLQ